MKGRILVNHASAFVYIINCLKRRIQKCSLGRYNTRFICTPSRPKVVDSLAQQNCGELAVTKPLDAKAILSLIPEVKRRLLKENSSCLLCVFWSTTLYNEKCHQASHLTNKTFLLKTNKITSDCSKGLANHSNA